MAFKDMRDYSLAPYTNAFTCMARHEPLLCDHKEFPLWGSTQMKHNERFTEQLIQDVFLGLISL